ncbi:MAG: DUF2835 domain-containing protein [Ectothiorhodospiraceae bacterium]|nr:DUF2835 domain-containing protein [Ectothiorhodospiraceae bacterium]
MPEYQFRLSISAQKYLSFYEGVAQEVVVTLSNGQSLQFPAEILRPFVTREGVYGKFVLRVDAQNKLQGIDRVGE